MKSREILTSVAIGKLDFGGNLIYDPNMTNENPFAGLGKALARLRKQAGFKTQKVASESLKIDGGQLSRWENEVAAPSLENLGRLLAGYGATVADLAEALGATARQAAEEDLGSPDDLVRSLAEALRRVEGRQLETEGRVDRIERGLGAAVSPRTPGGG